jgi:hypothetical protein
MTMDRRMLLWGGGAAALAVSIAALRSDSGGAAATGRPILIAPERGGDGSFGLGILDLRQRSISRIPVPFLAHSLVPDPNSPHRVVMCAQRPGRHSMVVDLLTRKVIQTFDSGEGRHFYGHGLFSADGTRFYATENRYDDGAGVISVRAAQDFREIGLLESHGIGPHELLPLGDGHVVIANGGARTDPRTDELVSDGPLESSLTVVQLETGTLVESASLGDPTLSIRHLAVASDQTVVCALKRYGSTPVSVAPRAPAASAPTIAFWRAGGPIEIGRCTDQQRDAQGALALSVAVHEATGTAVATHPTANLVTLWSVGECRQVGAISVRKPEGVAVGPDGKDIWVTTQTGKISRLDIAAQTLRAIAGIRGLDWKHSQWLNLPG